MAFKTGLGGIGVEESDIQAGMASNMDLHTPPVKEMLQLQGKDFIVNTLNAISNGGPFQFVLPGEGTEFISLPETRLQGIFSVRRADGTALDSTDKVSLCNLAPHSFFNQVEVQLNNRIASNLADRNYAYYATIAEMLSYGYEAKLYQLQGCHKYLDDTVGKASETNITNHEALAKRQKWIANSAECDFSVPIHSGIMQCPRYIPPNVEVTIKLERNKDSFSLIAPPPAEGATATQYIIKFHKLELKVRKIIVTDDALKAHFQKMSKGPALYPFIKTRVQDFLIAKDSQVLSIPNVVRGKLPSQLIVTYVSQAAFAGSINKNPYNFESFNLNSIYITVNGVPTPHPPYKPDFKNKLVTNEYRAMMDNLQVGTDNCSIAISKEMFMDGKAFYVFDLTPDRCGTYHIHHLQQGNIDIHMSFEDKLTEPVVMLCYMVLNDEYVTIDKDGNVDMTQ